MEISKRASCVKPFQVMEVLEAAHLLEAQGKDVVHLEIGEPDFDTPEPVKRAACAAMDRGETHYTHSLGILPLRRAISDHYRKRYSVKIDPGRIIVTQGTSPAMLTLFSTILHPGDRVILSDPCYACYPNFIEFAGGEVLSVPVYEADSFQYRVAAVQRMIEESGPETVRAIVVNSPSNPTGTVLDADRMKRLAGLGPWIVSDEIYHGLVYEDREHSILEFTDEAFVFNGFSKLYAMTGWRLGYIIAPERFVRPMQRLCQNFFISANAMAQWAGVAALTEAQADVERMVATYAERRVYMLGRLRAMGFRIDSHPVGAFYILVNASRLMRDSYRLAFHILENARVGVTPGIDFGCGAEGYIRFSYANSLENITRGMDRLEAYLHEHHPGALTG